MFGRNIAAARYNQYIIDKRKARREADYASYRARNNTKEEAINLTTSFLKRNNVQPNVIHELEIYLNNNL